MTVLGGHRGVAAFALSVAVLVTGACGGSDGASSSDDKSTTTEAGEMSTTTVKSTTTTVAPRAEADDATKERAQAGTLQLADFGEGWTEFAPGSVWTPTDESCAYRAGGGPEDALLNGSVVGGPTLRLGENDAYVSSRSYAFPTEADAIAWVEIAKTDEWAECRRQVLQDFQDENETGLEESIITREAENLGQNGFEVYAQFGGKNASGEVEVGQAVLVYRVGRTVLVETDEQLYLEEGAAAQFKDDSFAALTAAYTRMSDPVSG